MISVYTLDVLHLCSKKMVLLKLNMKFLTPDLIQTLELGRSSSRMALDRHHLGRTSLFFYAIFQCESCFLCSSVRSLNNKSITCNVTFFKYFYQKEVALRTGCFKKLGPAVSGSVASNFEVFRWPLGMISWDLPKCRRCRKDCDYL